MFDFRKYSAITKIETIYALSGKIVCNYILSTDCEGFKNRLYSVFLCITARYQ